MQTTLTPENGNMAKTTSLHSINADRGLPKFKLLLWLVANKLNNLFPHQNVDAAIEQADFRVDLTRIDPDTWNRLSTFSPARTLSDLFWGSLDWESLARSLGNQVTVLEVGCGSGKYGAVLRDRLGNSFAGYVGLDITPHPRWHELRQDGRFKLVVGDSASISKHLSEANLIITQSALEHFEEDLTFFRQVAEHVAGRTRPLIQIHLMPTAACLSTFLWHGVRQYTPRTLSKITRLFDARTRKTLYSLGSDRCNRHHRRYITYPGLFGRKELRISHHAAYLLGLQNAIEEDQLSKGRKDPCFYALVMETGMTGQVAVGLKGAS